MNKAKIFLLFSILVSFIFIGGGCTEKRGKQQGGDGVGNGGDGIKLLFRDAKEVAAKKLLKVFPCNIATGKEKVRDWILNNKYQLIEDIRNSNHHWVVKNPMDKCGMTGKDRSNEIQFGEMDCKENIYDPDRAAWVLIHESVHHFGFTGKDGDAFADEVAETIQYSAERLCNTDPFSSDSCPVDGIEQGPGINDLSTYNPNGNYTEIKLPDYHLFTRNRICEAAGCGDWLPANNGEVEFYDVNDNIIRVPINGKSILLINPATHDQYLQTIGNLPCRITNKETFCNVTAGPGKGSELFGKRADLKTKVYFATVFNGTKCMRQFARLKFRRPGETEWFETEHVISYSK